MWRSSLNTAVEAVKFLTAELSEVSKTQHMTVKILKPAKTAEKMFSVFQEIDTTSVIDDNEKRTCRQMICGCFFCFGDEIYDDMPLLN